MAFKDDVDTAIRMAEYHETALHLPVTDSDVASSSKWMKDKLLPLLRRMSETLRYDNGGEYALAFEMTRRDRMMRTLMPDAVLPAEELTEQARAFLAKTPEADRDFAYCYDFILKFVRQFPQALAAAKSNGKRSAFIQAAKDIEPANREALMLRADLEQSRSRVAYLESSLAAIRKALDVADPA